MPALVQCMMIETFSLYGLVDPITNQRRIDVVITFILNQFSMKLKHGIYMALKLVYLSLECVEFLLVLIQSVRCQK
jgi:hypothetical protein